jgi:hypothetical protein
VREGIGEIVPHPDWGSEYRTPTRKQAKVALAALDAITSELERLRRANRTRPDYDLHCVDCGAAHNLDCSIPSVLWNQVAKDVGVLCVLCIDDRLAAAGLTCDVAEFYYVGTALRGRRYAETTGDLQLAEAELKRVREKVRRIGQIVPKPLRNGNASYFEDAQADAVHRLVAEIEESA